MNLIVLVSLLSKLRQFDRRDRWTRRQLEAYQADAFRRLRAFAYERSPFYRRLHRGLENAPLRELPVLTKAVMMENFDEVVTDRAVRLADLERHVTAIRGDERFLGRYWVNATSGSTGRRGLFLFNRSEWTTVLASFLRMYHRLRGPLLLPRRL
ncbi:MAG TPA: phenylacetate--CoA ligase family protein, partial [Nitrospirota bacterium]|nr:phenylacetate--CoA ligase family protein [Nitrospirota bacterium]